MSLKSKNHKVTRLLPSSTSSGKAFKRTKPASEIEWPPKKSVPVVDLSQYAFLIYGREKIGKTTTAASFPDAVFLMTEPGAKGESINKVDCTSWAHIRSAVEHMEEDDSFKTVVIDTVDNAYEMCLDYTCKKLGIDHPGVGSDGKEDWGKSWKAVSKEFTDAIIRIARTGRGVLFTSHARETTHKPKGGEEYSRIYPSMSNQARKVIEALVDFFFYAEYVRDIRTGETRRIFICEGDDSIWAGARSTPFTKAFPRFLPIKRDNGFEVIKKAFEGKYSGLDVDNLVPSTQTTATTKKFLRKVRASAQHD